MPQPAVLTTKLFFPPARENLVSRRRLVEKVAQGLQSSLLLISAPAGYGKTTLISEWRASKGRDHLTAWLSLDNDDNDPRRFLTYFVAALAILRDGFGETTLSLLQSVPPFPIPVILTTLINELGEIAESIALILDDYHAINNPAVHEAVTYLLDHLPSPMHLVILTRADPPLPLSRLRARNQLVEIRLVDLRFTVEETTAFLNQVMGLRLSNSQVEALEQRTEGWVAGLQLVALSMQGHKEVQDFVSTFTGSHRYIVDYLADEVLNSQPDAVQEFLLRTSILDRLTAPLCDMLTGRSDGQITLEKLDQTNLFLIPLDDERCWYRYHHLFADLLRNRLRQKYTDLFTGLHHSAAEWFERNKWMPEAFRHALAAGEQEYAARLVEQNALRMLLRGELTMLSDWIEQVASQSSSLPWLSIWHAWVFVQTGQQDKAEAVLDRVEQEKYSGIPPEDWREIQGHIAAIRAHIAVYRWDAASTIAYAHQALDILSESDLSIRSFTILVLGSAYLLIGDFQAAGQYLSEARRIGKDSGNLHVAVLSSFMLANFLIDQGQLHQAVELCYEALRLATTPSGQPLPVAARAYSGLSRVYYEWNDLDAVGRFSNQCIDLAKEWGNYNALFTAYLTLGRMKRAQGDMIGAQAYLDEAIQLMRDYQMAPGSSGLVETFQVGLWLANGNHSAAASWVEKNGFRVDDTVPPLREAEYRAFARVLLAQNEINSALVLLDRLLISADSVGKSGPVIEILVLKALVFQAKTDIPQALKAIERALALAEPGGYIRTFLDEGDAMMQLLQQTAKKGMFPQYVRKLLSAVHPKDKKGLVTQPLIEPLSERELEVLQLVAEGKSNQQIAGALFIARGTVKKHLNNIFGKLGVQSRMQCVARARELKLL